MSTAPRVAVVTGASAGIGKFTACTLAAEGWHVIAIGRNAARLAAAETEIRAASASGLVDALQLDLAMMQEVSAAAERIAGLTGRVDLLFNNAGGMTDEFRMTGEGLEANFAGNHLGGFLLTNRLLPLIKAAAADQPKGAVRIINTSSDGSEFIPGLNLDDMMNLDNFTFGLAYCSSKLANVLHAKGLAARLAGSGVVAHSFHPGTVDSNFFAHVPDETRAYTDGLAKISLADGADTMLWLARAAEAGQCSGEYWHLRALRPPNPVVNDPDVVERCWQESEKLVARALG